MKKRKRILCALLCAAMVLSACGKEPAQAPTEAAETAVPETTKAPAQPVTQADGKPASLGCKNVYLSDSVSPDTVVGTMAGETLTAGQLQFLYAMAVSGYRGEPFPDFSEPLFAQSCPLSQSDISWEQYFLSKAVQTWQVSTALVLESRQPQIITEAAFTPNAEQHAERITPDFPQYHLLYADKDCYTMPKMHEAWVAGLPETIEAAAKAHGFADGEAMAEAFGTTVDAVLSAARRINEGYSYYTSLWEAATPEEPLPGQTEVAEYADLRQILLIPEGGQAAADGTVSADETAWAAAERKAGELRSSWEKTFAAKKYPDAIFGNIAHESSMDAATSPDGGRLSSVTKGQLIAPLDSWVFDAQRKAGDCEAIPTPYGVALVYIKEFRTAQQEAQRTEEIRDDVGQILGDLLIRYDCQMDYSRVCLAALPEPTPVGLVDILYPDVGHEQYDELPLYFQDDYSTVRFGNSTVSVNGCGITSLACLGTYMSDRRVTPGQMAVRYANYCVGGGTNADIYRHVTPEMDFYLENIVFQWKPVEEAMQEGRKVITLQFKGLFTTTGHYMVLDRLTEEGNVVIRDSYLPHYGRIPGHKDGFFTPQQVYSAGVQYWIFSPKVVTLPACSRCGDGSSYALASAYTCRRCLTALGRLGGFTQSILG